jgi:hypothetical protein
MKSRTPEASTRPATKHSAAASRDQEPHARGEHAARDEAQCGGQPGSGSEASLEEFVHGDDAELVIERDRGAGQHEFSGQRSERELQVRPVAPVRRVRDADEGGGGELGGDHREQDGPGGQLASAEEQIGCGLMAARGARPDREHRDRVERDDRVVRRRHGAPPRTHDARFATPALAE